MTTDLELVEPPEAVDLARIVQLANRQITLERQVENAKTHLANLEKTLNTVRRLLLPSVMQEAGVTKLALDSGETVTLAEKVSANVSADRREEANRWLVAEGHGGIIKTVLSIPFATGERDKALEAQGRIREDLELASTIEEKIHPATLAAFVREALSKGLLDDDAMKLFGVFILRETEIKSPKKVKTITTTQED